MRVIFAGTPEFAKIQLEALLALNNVEICAVYTQPDRPSGRGQKISFSPVKNLAISHQIPVEQPQNFKSPESIEKLKSYAADVMVVAAYGLLLPQAILEAPKFGCINVHASVLPRWRGASPIQHAILAGDTETGITLMQMDLGMDTGDMLLVEKIQIGNQDNALILHNKLASLGAKMLKENLLKVITTPKPHKQNDNFATYAPKIQKQDTHLNFSNNTAAELFRKIKAFNPWPGAFCLLNEQRIKFLDSDVEYKDSNNDSQPGTITRVDDNGITISTKEGFLILKEYQLPGKQVQSATQNFAAQQSRFSVGKRFS